MNSPSRPTASELLHASHRLPALDYENLIRLTKALTRDIREVNKMVRLMVFNVIAGNRDDDAKNFSFLLDAEGMWKMAPAYDLTPSFGFGDEHSAMVNGKGKEIEGNDLLAAASVADVSAVAVREMIEQTRRYLQGSNV
ncbi:HipA domain-containing protein [Desulfovibrio sp. OttesenSCG-928-C06]|nr:HipA domain-containing protein [Desulfovibrio sp. OttesenSCG-928-C06]